MEWKDQPVKGCLHHIILIPDLAWFNIEIYGLHIIMRACRLFRFYFWMDALPIYLPVSPDLLIIVVHC